MSEEKLDIEKDLKEILEKLNSFTNKTGLLVELESYELGFWR